MDSWHCKAAVPLLFSPPHESLSCFPRITIHGTNFWTKSGNGSICRNTPPDWAGVVFCLVLTESDPSLWNWIVLSKLVLHSSPTNSCAEESEGVMSQGWDKDEWLRPDEQSIPELYVKHVLLCNLQLKSSLSYVAGPANSKLFPFHQWGCVCLQWVLGFNLSKPVREQNRLLYPPAHTKQSTGEWKGVVES